MKNKTTYSTQNLTDILKENNMKKLNKIGLLVLFTIIILLMTGCPGPFSTIDDKNFEQDQEILDNQIAIAVLDSRMDTAEAEINDLQAWAIETDETLAEYLILIGNNTAAITEVAEDLVDLEERSDANDADHQAQLDRLRARLDRAFRLIRTKYREVMDRIDDVIDQANADRREYRRGLMLAYRGIAYNRMQIIQLWDAFEETAEDFQEQLDTINDDLTEIKNRLTDAIEDFMEYTQINTENINEILEEIRFIWEELYYIANNYSTTEEMEEILEEIELDIEAVAALVEALPTDPVNWAGVFATLGDVTDVVAGNMLYTIQDSTLWIVVEDSGSLQLMSVARPGGTMYYNL